MELYKAIQNRRNVHHFKDEAVPKDKLKKILEKGLLASSAMNEQPWEFIAVSDQDLVKKIAQFKYDHNMQGLLASNFPMEQAEEMAGLQRDAFTNSLPVVVIYDTEKRIPSESSWNCITTIWLAATAEGLGLSPAFFGLHAQGPLKEILGIPEGYDIAAILRIGIPAEIPDAKPRKSLHESLHKDRFGGGSAL